MYAMLVFYAGLGFMTAIGANFPFPNTYKNSPYVLNYLLGIMSLMCIFSTTILAAQSLFREKDANFDAILFATPLQKVPYVSSRFLIIFSITFAGYFLFLCGLMAGQSLEASGNQAFTQFALWNYLQPFLLLLVPNILFCTAVACTIGLVTRNKMLVYVSGIFIYFLYWGVALFTNSPLMASATPASTESMNWSAKLDPFGVAAFFEQTRFWTATERNSQLLQLTGNLLVNRTLYLFISAMLLVFAYRKFSFAIHQNKTSKTESSPKVSTREHIYETILTRTTGILYDLRSIRSLTRIEFLNIIKSIPLWVICTGWAAFLTIEIFSTIDGNSRIPELFASTDIMITTIMDALPMVTLIILLFYGSEVFWRSHNSRFSALEETTAIKPIASLLSKTLTLTFVIALLIGLSIAIAIGIQLAFHNSPINGKLYLSLFYLLGLPLTFSAALIISIQALVKNRYLGIVVAGLVLVITNTSVGNLIGFRHPLLRFANVFQGNYSELNGFGSALQAFDIKMLYWLCISSIIFIIASKVWSYKKGAGFFTSALKWTSPLLLILLICGFGAIASGNMIYSKTKLPDRNQINNWKQSYEEKYSRLKNLPQPTITDVKTAIDLFPESESYQVYGEYMLVNKTPSPIDKIYIYGDREIQWSEWQLENGSLQEQDTNYGYYTFLPDKSLQPGESTKLKFRFTYSGSPFNAPASFNTIIANGSFIRISNYFPRPGYNSDNEIDDARERAQRNLPESNNLTPLTEMIGEPFDYGFITFDAVVSTSGDQTAISVGELTEQWKQENRNYFHYKSDTQIPFRFAVSSARYALKKATHRNINIEVYYHPDHYQNIDHLLTVAKSTLDYCGQQIAAYPFQTLRCVEISSFTRGFAGTAYPTNLFINESFGFQNKIDSNPARDIIHEMVSHEISHEWWGDAKIAPDYREGSKLLTETLAMYTELMMYKNTYGEEHLLDRVNVHKDIYLSERTFAEEEPLYKSDPDKSYLVYDKGMVVVYQLYKLLGEEKVNQALKSFYNKYAYPNKPPVSTDLINEFYTVADKGLHAKIDELFKQIVTYDLSLLAAGSVQNTDGSYTVDIDASALKSVEDGKGKNERILFTEPIEAAIFFANNKKQIVILKADDNKVTSKLVFPDKPLKVVLDPEGKFLDKSEEDNQKNF